MTAVDLRLALMASTVDGAVSEELTHRFDRTEIIISCDAKHSLLALSLANLTARLWPNTKVSEVGAGAQTGMFGTGSFAMVAEALVSAVRLSRPVSPDVVMRVALGDVGGPADIFASADAWSMRIATSATPMLDCTPGPATTAAAALIAAELFRRTLPELPGLRLSKAFEWNLKDYGTTVAQGDLVVAPIDATCFGAGSVGSSLVLALLVGGYHGRLHLVDDDVLQAHNRLRYPLWIGAAAGSKAEWVARVAAGTGLEVVPHSMTAAMYDPEGLHPPRLAVAAVDTPSARAEVADQLAAVSLNAGVDGLRFHVSRHGFADGFACVYCQYVNVEAPASQSAVYEDLTGLPAGRVVELLQGARLEQSDVATLIRTGRLQADDAGDLVGGRLADVARARLYAAASVPEAQAVAVVAPFVSALVGSVLAAEVLKGVGATNALDRRVDVDLSGWPTGITSRPIQDPSRRCICWGAHRARAWRTVWDGDQAPGHVR